MKKTIPVIELGRLDPELLPAGHPDRWDLDMITLNSTMLDVRRRLLELLNGNEQAWNRLQKDIDDAL